MFNHTFLSIKNANNKLQTKLIFSTLAVTLLLTTSSLAQANNSPAIDCKNDNVTYPTQKNKAVASQNKQQRLIGCMLTQLQQYQQPKYSARQQYLAYKAQAWLNYANYQASTNSKTAAGHHAFQEASNILTALHKGTDEQINLTPNIPSTSALMRPDLWATLNALKGSGGIMIAPRELAFSEVALIWAATEQCKYGSQQSGAHFRMSDRWLEQAREAYINNHDSKTNVALEERINQYFKKYTPLDTGEGKCQGQVLPASIQSVSEAMLPKPSLLEKERNVKSKMKLNTQPITTVMRTDALQIKITRTLSTVQLSTNIAQPSPTSTSIPMPVPTATYKIAE